MDQAETRRRRGPRATVARPAKARPPRSETLTLEKFTAAFTDSLLSFIPVRFDEDGRPVEYKDEARDVALALRRAAVEQGDLLALYSALESCLLYRFGWPGLFAVHDSSARPDEAEVPRWLLETLLKHVWRGIHGVWPKGRARHSTAAGLLIDRRAHLGRAYQVLKARKEGTPWERVFEEVSRHMRDQGRGDVSPRAFEDSYRKVAKAFRSKETLRAFLFEPRFPVPQDWGP